MPNIIINNSTLLGVDSDNDNIRDDIQIWIDEHYYNQPTRLALRQVAKERQLNLGYYNNKEQSVISSKKYLDALICLSSIVGIDQKAKLNRELESMLLNTKVKINGRNKI